MSGIERTLVLLKPDAVQRAVVGEILSRFERVGLTIVGMKLVHINAEFSRKHYSDLVDKPFYKGLETMITEGPVVALVLEGIESVALVRKMVGATEPKGSAPGTIRGDYAHVSYGYADAKGIAMKNLIHASGNVADAAKEVPLWFAPAELHSYKTAHHKHVQ